MQARRSLPWLALIIAGVSPSVASIGQDLTITRSSASGSIIAVSPQTASPGLEIAITGTGFHPSAHQNEVFFIPAAGPAVSARATSIEKIGNEPHPNERTKVHPGVRRLRVRVPDAARSGVNALRVVDVIHSIVAEGKSIDIAPGFVVTPDNAPQNTRGLAVTITAAPVVTFVAGRTEVRFGDGITTKSVDVQSSTRLVATTDIADTAVIGPRTITIETGSQRYRVIDGFRVTAATPPPTNTAPVVSAGPDTTVTLPGAATLAGSAADDGLPAGSMLTVTWTKVSGPGAVTFANAAAASTTATFGAAGTYELELTATDGALSSHDTVSIVVKAAPPVNQPPSADAGVDQTITQPQNSTQLQAVVSDDGLPAGSSLSITWSMTGGPAQAVFANPASAATSVTLAAVGDYVLRITVSDGELSASDEVAVKVKAAEPVNQAPSVSAGADQTITLPSSAVLAGTATDDGLPAGRSLSVTWTVVSGPGAVQFANAASSSTTASFVVAGSYVLRLTATDGELTSSADVSVTVNAPIPTNQPPSVNAGADQIITQPQDFAQLAATIADDGRPAGGSLGVTWSMVSGPSPAVFAHPTSANTSVSLSAVGGYLLRATVSDGELSASDDVMVTVLAPPVVNKAPIVSAGPDLAITFPDHVVTLSGVVSDDDLPSPPVLAPRWNVASGPSPVSFAPQTAASTSATFTEPGAYVLRLTVTDGELTAADEVTVIVNPGTPPPAENHPPVARPGGPYSGDAKSALAFSGALSSDADGDALTFAWSFGDGGSATGPMPQHVFASPGAYIVSLSVTDARGASHSATVQASIGPEADRVPPAVTLLAPHATLPGAAVAVTALVSDNASVASVAFLVNGQPSSTDTSAPYQATIPVPSLATPGTVITVNAVATDTSGNTGVAEAAVSITATPDTVSPSVTVNAPATAATGSTILFTATASDAVGVASVTFTLDGQPVGVDVAPPYGASVAVPAGATPGTLLVVGARAADLAGNVADASATVSVSSAPDTTAPTVAVVAPATISAGGEFDIEATAEDNTAVASVRLLVDGVEVGAFSTPPYRAHYAVSASRPTGSVLFVEAEAIDTAGLAAIASTDTVVVATGGAGAIVGEVYDDRTGLPLHGADVVIAALGGSLQPAATTSDGRGGYAAGAAGTVHVRISKDGWSSVERTVVVPDGRAAQAIDVRLTPRSQPFAVSMGLGKAIAVEGASLTVPPGALTSDATVFVTAIGPQGLRGLLPAGWSPVAAIDVWPEAIAFATPATLTAPNSFSVPVGAGLTLAKWDSASSAWTAVEHATVPADGQLRASIGAGGQYAWLLADQVPVAPPTPDAGDVLAASTVPGIVPADATLTISPQPKIAVYSPDVRARVTATLNLSAPIASGSVLRARVSEAYHFAASPTAAPEPFVADVVLYQFPGAPVTHGARFTVSPSVTFEPASLLDGVIGIDISAPGSVSPTVPVIGSAGGTSTATETGEALNVAPGAVSSPTPIAIERLAAGAIGVSLGGTLDFIGAVRVTVSGPEFSAPASLAVPRPSALVDDAGIFLVKLVDVGGATRLIVVGLGRIAGERVVSDVSVQGIAMPLAGIRGSGRYVFVRAKVPTSLVTGGVQRSSGPAVADALVTSDVLPIAALSRANGGYVLPVAAGAVTLTAVDVASSDRASVVASVAAGAIATRTLVLQVQPPRVLTISPSAGATNVPLGAAVVIGMSEPVAPASVAPAVRLETSAGAQVVATVELSNGDRTITLRATDPLSPDSPYVVRISTALQDLSGNPLPSAVTSTFTSLDVTAPLPPAAGSITATLPSNGESTVTGTQGSAGLHDTVRVTNVTKNTFVQAPVNPNGSFSATVVASLADKLIVSIVDANGNETSVPVPGFSQTNADGSRTTVVGKPGGRVHGPAGISVDVPADAFPEGTPVTINAVDEASFPIALTAQQQNLFAYSGGLSLDFGGHEPGSYLNVSIPKGANDKLSDRWVVVAIETVGGRQVMSAVDTAQIIDGRITTSSPPCPGVLAARTYGFVKSTRQPIGVIYSQSNPLLNAQLSFMQLVQEGSFSLEAADAIPWGVTSASLFPQPQCFPILTGRATVTPNSQRIVVAANEFVPADRTLVVKNVTLGTELRFPRNVVEYRFPVNGSVDDSFTVQVKAGGNLTTVPYDIAPFSPGRVLIRLDMDKVTTQVTEVVVRNLSSTPVDESTFPQAGAEAKVRMTGGASDAYEVTVLDSADVTRAVAFSIESPTGSGNLVARVLNGTIDPGSTVTLVNRATNAETPIPPALHADDGGFEFAFDGSVSDLYKLNILEGNVVVDHVYMPAVRIMITNPETGRVIREVVVPAPPMDDPFYNLGVLSSDGQAPMLVGSPNGLTAFDPAGVLSFTFSEGVDRESALSGVELKDQNGKVVAGEVRLSAGNTVVTFVPAAALKLGQSYTLTLSGIKDGANNKMDAFALDIKTFEPTLTHTTEAPFGVNGRFRDIAFLNRDLGNGQILRRAYALVDNLTSAWLVTLDMAKPSQPTVISQQIGPNGQIVVVQDVKDLPLREPTACGSGTVFNGDLAITTFQHDFSVSAQFWDLTNPDLPCNMGSKLFVLNPTFFDNQSGVAPGIGFPRGLTALRTNKGLFAYAAIGQMGLFQADIGYNSPSASPHAKREPFVSGNYDDVVPIRGPLLAATNRGANQLDLFDPSLGLIASVQLGELNEQATQLAYAEDFGIDADANGIIDAQERHDIIFVAGTAGLVAVDVTSPDQAFVLGRINMPGWTYQVQVDAERRRVFATGTREKAASNFGLFIVDLSAPDPFVSLDVDDDGIDDRVIWQTPPNAFPNTVIGAGGAMVLDVRRGTIYYDKVGNGLDSPAKLEVWSVYNRCCDLGVAMQRELDLPDTSDPETMLKREKAALQKGITAGLAAAASCGVPIRQPGSPLTANAVAILEQGSGACVWKDNIVEACSPTYQPGLSDHDFEVFVPASFYPGSEVTGAKCVAKKLAEEFTVDGKPKEIDLGNGVKVSFSDITFFPVRREPFEQAKLDLDLPPNSSGDTTGDIGLGRQQLLLKWLLEGEYVVLAAYDVKGKDLEAILERMRSITRVPVLEGFEWGVLQRYSLTKSKAFLRIRGASDSLSAFYPLFIAQLHDAGKAGIRAALARMVADPAAADVVLNMTRGDYASQGCLEIPVGSAKKEWGPAIKCDGFEQYIASAAARTVLKGLPVFSESDVSTLIQRFYEVKADQGDRITTEPEADQFIVSAAKFVDRVVAETQTAYDLTLPADPDVAQRTGNMLKAVSATTSALKNAKLHVVPQVFNFGFTGADNVTVAMYRGTPAGGVGQEVKKLEVTLQPNELRSLRSAADTKLPEPADGITPEDRNLLDVSSVTINSLDPLFTLGEKDSAVNPPVDLTQNIGLNRYVAFTIDLPDRRFKEAFRENNIGGFFYYVLDRVNGVSDQPPPKIPLPLPDPDGTLLEPDAECTTSADLQITQAVLIEDIDDPATPTVISDFITVEPNENVNIRLRVKNDAGFALDHVKACSSLRTTEPCLDAGTLAVGEQKDLAFTWTAPGESQFIEAIATAQAAGVGTRRSPSMGIAVGCEQYLVVPAPNFDSPPLNSIGAQVMRGGQGIRHYRVVDKDTGLPVSGIVVEVEVQATGRPTEIRSYVSNLDGVLGIGGDAAVIVPVPADHHEAGHTIVGRIVKVQAQPAYCQANTTLYAINVVDRQFKHTYNAGATIDAKGAVTKGLSGKFGVGFGMAIADVSGKGPQSLTIDRQFSSGLGIVHEVAGLGIEAEALGGKAKLGVEVEAGATAMATQSETHVLPYDPVTKQLTNEERAVFGALMLSTASVGLSSSPFFRKIFDTALGLVDPEPYRQKHTVAATVETKGSFEAQAVVGLGLTNSNNQAIQYGVQATATAELKFGVGVSVADAEKAKEITPAVEIKGGLDVQTALGLDAGLENEIAGKKKIGVISKFKVGLKGTVMGSMKVSAVLDRDNPDKVKKLMLAFANPKKFGFSASGSGFTPIDIGFGDKQTITFTITNEEQIESVMEELAIAGRLAAPWVASAATGVPDISDASLVQEVGKVVDALIKSDAEYAITEDIGQAVSLPLGFGITIENVELKVKGVPAMDTSLNYVLESGVVKNGQLHALARYTNDQLIPDFSDPGDAFMVLVNNAYAAFGALAGTAFDKVTDAVANAIKTVRTNFTAELTIDGTGEQPFEVSILSWHFEPASNPNPSGAYIYRPTDIRGRPDLPHYGIGHFHQFWPADKVLINPATMTIEYHDEEVASFNESQLAVYRWNDTTEDWDYLGGTPDPANNKVTVQIDRLGLYTAAPPMPAGHLEFTGQSDPAGPNGVTSTYTSGPLKLNTGQPVSDGTLYTVSPMAPGGGLVPFGTVLTADADPQTPGIQVAASGGTIQFTVHYPQGASQSLVLVYSREGTALSTQVLPVSFQ